MKAQTGPRPTSSQRHRTLTTSCTAVLILSLVAACGGDDGGGDSQDGGGNPADAEATDEPLQVWVRQAEDGGLPTYQEMADLYEEETGQAIELYGEVTGFEESLIRAASAGNLPDAIIYDTEGLGQLVDWGMVQEIDPDVLENRDEILDLAWTAAQGVDGSYYAVPTSTQAFNLYIRSDWRDNLGLDDPQTWDDVVEIARAFTHDDPDENGEDDTTGYVVPGSSQRGYASWFWITLLWQAGGDYFEPQDDGTFVPTLDTPEAREAMQWLHDMVFDHQVVQPGTANHVTADSHPYFQSGESGLYHTGPYMIAGFDDEPGQDVYDVIEPVTGPAGNDTLAEGEQLYVMTGTDKADQALAFAEWVASPEGQEAGMNPGGYSVVRLPINENVSAGEVYDHPYWDVVAETFAESGRYVTPVPNFGPFRQIVADTVNIVISDPDADIDLLMDDLNEQVAAELDAQGVLAE
ncbi:ABC transporter substrate-binding protein [Phytoactinopolyspora endophytica]|uniref:ABC transporter substrate-binding protein n=1 Tax=Phytoactinopolyspora endophytica TaxID=1642495 RepID=UPI00101DDEB8|nr:sugar ABC transporter substrate-binding protein [Phytoactinopolyspora endophytica]